MVRDGHRVVLSTWYGLQGKPMPWAIPSRDGQSEVGKVLVLPSVDGHNYDNDAMIQATKSYQADCLITIADVWVFRKQLTKHVNFCPWLPVDHDPVPGIVVDSLETAVYPMVMSKWGQDRLDDLGIKAKYVPGSAPADVFRPGDKQTARKGFNIPDNVDFLVTMVAANKDPNDRKGFSEAIPAFAKFLETHPNSRLYIHSRWAGPVNIQALVNTLGIQDYVMKPDPYAYDTGLMDEKYMNNVYNASDLLLNPSKSEGFGLPLIEAQMAGCPIAAIDFSTTDELLFGGWKIPGQPAWNLGQNSFRLRAFIDGIVDVLQEAYDNKDNKKLQKKCRNGATRYDNDTVFNQFWKPALKDIETLTERKVQFNESTKDIPLVTI